MKKLIECVPNFSEGQRPEVLEQLAAAIGSVPQVKLLHTDTGYAANRTVFTFAGAPEAVAEAAFRAAKVAQEQIDMSRHTGVHPRSGALDVCPLVPVRGISMEETVLLARKLAERIGTALDYPVFCYEEAAFPGKPTNLADLRRGEYEGLAERLRSGALVPDFGPAEFRPQSGMSVVGARHFLLAVNFNLNTQDTRLAKAIAAAVRESGKKVRKNGKLTRIPGRCPGTKAIGWYIEDFGIAQVSMNITRLDQTPLHEAFRVVSEEAAKRGAQVTGTEIIGLVPQFVFQEAAEYFKLQEKSEEEQVREIMERLGLATLLPFEPAQKILEYALLHKT